uniref:Cystatin domain-containing protein n=1 Tax=Rhabditophanes sp. KR3021 TaxID=114890 RepID=A0AC35UC17_9BILA
MVTLFLLLIIFVINGNAQNGGGISPISVNDPDVIKFARRSLLKFNRQISKDPSWYIIEKITSAQIQSVAGNKYFFNYIAIQTACSKAEIGYLKAYSWPCANRKKAKRVQIKATLLDQPWLKSITIGINCYKYL